MKVFFPSPEARITARSQRQIQPAGGLPRIDVAVTLGPNRAPGVAQEDGTDVVTLLVGKEGQPHRLPALLAGHGQPAAPSPLFIESAVVTPILQHIGRSHEHRGAWRSAVAQLSWMPRTAFGDKAGLQPVERMSLTTVDWALFCAGLVIGIAALPTIYPVVRCVRAYRATIALRDGMVDLQLANQLLQTARALPEVTAATAQNLLLVYRGQACRPRIFSVEHRSGWSSLAEAELLTYLDSKVPGFSLQVRAQDVRDNRNAMLLQLGTQALVMATQPALESRTQSSEAGGIGQTKAADSGLDWHQLAYSALAVSAYS